MSLKEKPINYYKKIAIDIAKEVASNLLWGRFIVPIVELVQNLISPDQLEAAIKWIQDTKELSIKGENGIKQTSLREWLEEQFSKDPNSTYAQGYPRSFVKDGKLIQFSTSNSSSHLIARETKYWGEFAPRKITDTLIVFLADKWEMGESVGAMPGDGLPILVPSVDAIITALQFETSKLSSPIVSHFNRQMVSIDRRNGSANIHKFEPLSNWDDVLNILQSEIPSITDVLPTLK